MFHFHKYIINVITSITLTISSIFVLTWVLDRSTIEGTYGAFFCHLLFITSKLRRTLVSRRQSPPVVFLENKKLTRWKECWAQLIDILFWFLPHLLMYEQSRISQLSEDPIKLTSYGNSPATLKSTSFKANGLQSSMKRENLAVETSSCRKHLSIATVWTHGESFIRALSMMTDITSNFLLFNQHFLTLSHSEFARSSSLVDLFFLNSLLFQYAETSSLERSIGDLKWWDLARRGVVVERAARGCHRHDHHISSITEIATIEQQVYRLTTSRLSILYSLSLPPFGERTCRMERRSRVDLFFLFTCLSIFSNSSKHLVEESNGILYTSSMLDFSIDSLETKCVTSSIDVEKVKWALLHSNTKPIYYLHGERQRIPTFASSAENRNDCRHEIPRWSSVCLTIVPTQCECAAMFLLRSMTSSRPTIP